MGPVGVVCGGIPPTLPSPFVANWSGAVGSSHPSARLWEGLVYDPVDREFVLFGGSDGNLTAQGDTWTFQEGAWTNLTPSLPSAPSARYYPGMTWDPALGAVLLFGGQSNDTSLSDTWTFVHGRWTNLTRAIGPAPSGRSYAALSYDSADQVVLLFGGFNESPLQEYGDTWEFNGTRWTNLTSRLSLSPPPRPDAGIVDDLGDGMVILFGGDSPHDSVPFYNDTWGFAGARWTNLTGRSALAPSGREDPAMTFDEGAGSAVLFGGTTTPGAPNLHDTWTYRGFEWSNLSSYLPFAPTARGGARMAYDPANGNVLLFGGVAQTVLADTWILTFHPCPAGASPAPASATWLVAVPVVATTALAGLLTWRRRTRGRGSARGSR